MEALVQYGSSDDEEDDSTVTGQPSSVALVSDAMFGVAEGPPVQHDLLAPPLRKRGKVRILVPDLPDVDSKEEPSVERRAGPASSLSQFLSHLPRPKGDEQRQHSDSLLLPTVLQKKPLPKSDRSELQVEQRTVTSTCKAQGRVQVDVEEPEEDEEGLPDVDGNFFSIVSESPKAAPVESPSSSTVQIIEPKKVPIAPSDVPDVAVRNMAYDVAPEPSSSSYGEAHGMASKSHRSRSGDQSISIEQARKLIGKHETDPLSGRSVPDDLEIVDVNVDQQLHGVRENLLRNLTGPRPADAMLNAAKDDSKTNPGGVAKRKHQITYLAFLAKEREEQLQNQWAQNRYTRKQSRIKYGF